MYSFTNVDNFTNSYKGFRSYGERYLILDGPRNGPGWVVIMQVSVGHVVF